MMPGRDRKAPPRCIHRQTTGTRCRRSAVPGLYPQLCAACHRRRHAAGLLVVHAPRFVLRLEQLRREQTAHGLERALEVIAAGRRARARRALLRRGAA